MGCRGRGQAMAEVERFLPRQKMAGAGGFEPPNAGAKVPCLTAWPRPTNERGFRHGPPADFPGGVKAAGPENCCGKSGGQLSGRAKPASTAGDRSEEHT